jgi:Protein of unknown function (DUF3800)
METHTPQKLYAYVDKSGQDTEGRFFVVSVVLFGTERDTVLTRLEALEERSRKGRVKWRRARYAFRQDYIAGLLDMPLLAESIFVATFHNARNYFELTVESTARAITAKTQGGPYRVTIFVDGPTRPEQATFTNRLRARGIARKKVRGVRDERSNAGVRLADALCGLIRDADEGEPWAVAILTQLRQRGVVTLV